MRVRFSNRNRRVRPMLMGARSCAQKKKKNEDNSGSVPVGLPLGLIMNVTSLLRIPPILDFFSVFFPVSMTVTTPGEYCYESRLRWETKRKHVFYWPRAPPQWGPLARRWGCARQYIVSIQYTDCRRKQDHSTGRLRKEPQKTVGLKNTWETRKSTAVLLCQS